MLVAIEIKPVTQDSEIKTAGVDHHKCAVGANRYMIHGVMSNLPFYFYVWIKGGWVRSTTTTPPPAGGIGVAHIPHGSTD